MADAVQCRQIRSTTDYQKEEYYHLQLQPPLSTSADCQTGKVPWRHNQLDLSWNQHVDKTVEKGTYSHNFLRLNIRECPPKEQCYKTLVPQTMEYASCVWDPNINTNIKKLEMVQQIAVSFVKGDYDRTSSVTAMLDELGWDTLQEWRQQAKAQMFLRIVYGLVCIPSTPFLIPTRASTTRGHDMKFLVPQSSVKAHKYSFFQAQQGYGINFHSRLSQHLA